jgi:putative oxidoreductase
MQIFKPPILPYRASAGLLVVRLVAGLAFVLHGWPKIQDPVGWMGPESTYPGILVALAAVAEFGGGLAWILGFLTPLASFGIACTMAEAVRLHAYLKGDPFVDTAGGGSYELPLVFLSIAILLLLAGPGSASVDRIVFREKAPRPHI